MLDRKAATAEEYQEAVDVIRWLRTRGNEALERGDKAKALILVMAASQIERVFLLPD